MSEPANNPFAAALADFTAVAPEPVEAAAAAETNTPENTDGTVIPDEELSFEDALNRGLDGLSDTGDADEGAEGEEGADADAKAKADAQAAKEEAEQEEQVKTEMGLKAHERFKVIKDELKTTRGELATLKAELEKAKLTGKVTGGEEVEQLKAALKEKENRLAIFDVQTTPEYQEAVTKPLGVITEFCEQVGKNFGVDVDELIDALRLPDEKSQTTALDKILAESGVPDRVRLRIYQAANDLPHIWAKRDELSSNAAAALQEIEARRTEEKTKSSTETLAKHAEALNNVWDQVELSVLRSLPTVDIKAVREQAASVKLDAIEPEAQAFSIYAAVLLPQLQRKLAEVTASEAALKAKLGRVKGALPGAGGGKAAAAAAAINADLSFADAIEAGLRAG